MKSAIVSHLVHVNNIFISIVLDIGTTGEVLLIHNISRFCGGIYECEAQNGIGLGDRRSINVDVECKNSV